jgi:hypothetical protein
MTMNKPTSDVISSYRRRRRAQGPFIIYGLAGLLVLAGLIMLVVWLTGPSQPLQTLFATDTPTPTITPSPTNTSTPTATATETLTPTVTFTPTPSAPFEYTVQEGEYLAMIVEKFGLGDNGVALITLLNPYTSEGASFTTPVIISGASAGIGRALARQLSEKGARLTLAARRGEKLRQLNDELGGKHLVVVADVGKPEDCRRIVVEAQQRFARK